MELNSLSEAVIKGDIPKATQETQRALDAGVNPQSILDEGLIAPMDIVGDRFSKGTMFVPQMLRSAKTMENCVSLLKPLFQDGTVVSKGTIVLGTVQGDLHDIGKNLVGMMLEGAGFTIVDLGVDIAPDVFVSTVTEQKPQIVGLSALLSTTMPAMSATIDALTKAGYREDVKIMIGGAPVTSKFAEDIGADRYAPDAGTAVTAAKNLMNIE